jgi:hypothetical protein
MICLTVIVSTTKSPIHCPLTKYDPACQQSRQLPACPKCTVLQFFDKKQMKKKSGVLTGISYYRKDKNILL